MSCRLSSEAMRSTVEVERGVRVIGIEFDVGSNWVELGESFLEGGMSFLVSNGESGMRISEGGRR